MLNKTHKNQRVPVLSGGDNLNKNYFCMKKNTQSTFVMLTLDNKDKSSFVKCWLLRTTVKNIFEILKCIFLKMA